MPNTPMNKIAKIAWAYDSYRQKQPKATIPDIDSVKDMEKTLKKLGMKESVNETMKKWSDIPKKGVINFGTYGKYMILSKTSDAIRGKFI